MQSELSIFTRATPRETICGQDNSRETQMNSPHIEDKGLGTTLKCEKLAKTAAVLQGLLNSLFFLPTSPPFSSGFLSLFLSKC
jgi:hypothetical protein